MAKLAGTIIDEATGQRIDARVQVLASSGRFICPADSILKVGPGVPFFYSDGSFEVDVTRGPTQVLVERGTEYVPGRITVDLPAQGTHTTETRSTFDRENQGTVDRVSLGSVICT